MFYFIIFMIYKKIEREKEIQGTMGELLFRVGHWIGSILKY